MPGTWIIKLRDWIIRAEVHDSYPRRSLGGAFFEIDRRKICLARELEGVSPAFGVLLFEIQFISVEGRIHAKVDAVPYSFSKRFYRSIADETPTRTVYCHEEELSSDAVQTGDREEIKSYFTKFKRYITAPRSCEASISAYGFLISDCSKECREGLRNHLDVSFELTRLHCFKVYRVFLYIFRDERSSQ